MPFIPQIGVSNRPSSFFGHGWHPGGAKTNNRTGLMQTAILQSCAWWSANHNYGDLTMAKATKALQIKDLIG